MSPLYVARTGRYGRHVDVLAYIRDGLWMAFQMAWEVWWALVLGFLLSGTVQAWVPRARMEHALGGFLNIVFTGVAAALVAFTLRRGAKDPVCRMTVDLHKTPHRSRYRDSVVYCRGAGCKAKFDADPDPYMEPTGHEAPAPTPVTTSTTLVADATGRGTRTARSP